MSEDSFAAFYQEELVALRRDAYRFGKRHSEMAGSLGLHWGDSPDPMAERVIEAMAWFAARVRRDSQARMPLAARQILQRIHPHFVRPVPSIGIASLTPTDNFAEAHPAGRILPAGSRFHCADPDGGVIRWRTGHPIRLNGARVVDCGFDGDSLNLVVKDIRDLPSLRLFPWGNPFTAHSLHQWVHSGAADVLVDGESIGRDSLTPGGLSPEELALPRDSFAHPGYQLLQEYFVCPDRFLFWDIDLSRSPERRAEMKISIPLRLPPPDSVRLDLVRFDTCAVPLVNLHERMAEPILVEHTRHSYPLEPDRTNPDAAEIHSILEVEAIRPGGASFAVPPHGAAGMKTGATGWRWYERRTPRTTGTGTDVELFFKSTNPEDSDEPFTVSARVLCTDRGRAAAVGNNTELKNDDEMEITSAVMERPPTRQYDPPLSGDDLWRLVDAMTARRGELSGKNGLSAIRETLRLFIPDGCRGAHAQADAITGWKSEDTLVPLRPSRHLPMGGAARGHAFTMRLDPNGFKNSSPFLFASVVDSFLSLFAGINSVTQLTAYAGDDELRAWPPRLGSRRL